MAADIPALIGPLSIDRGEITSTNTAGGTSKRLFPGFVAVNANNPGQELRNVGTIPVAYHVTNWTFAETRRLGLAAQGTAK